MNIISSYIMVVIILFSNLTLFSYVVECKILKQITTNETQKNTAWTSSCPHARIQVSQGDESNIGIPRYIVMIANLCTNCSVAKVHLHCGWFASATIVNPRLFKRIAYNDCLVNGGNPIPSGHVIQFVYSNTYKYSLSVASFVCDVST
ncbi:hypothetical protein CDL12_09121 [Handroanthus impetiginosus]|uniref:Uncharacterized protein n=1 Tax=Handroanthus impetiginosus TaxID=429701 RepID=A0A2G9HL14_9LAMI|nr:hypothetical protein CDL12_09121 [Handroanthus impetiginosus]